MEPVDPDDERARFRKPPLPADRVWLHPSELGRAASAPEDRRMAPVVVATAVVASLLSGGLVLGAVTLLDRASRPRVAQRAVVDEPLSAGSMADVVERVRPSVASVRVGSPPVATGSGVILRDDGHVLTSAHLVAGGGPIVVVLHDQRELNARLVGADAETDAAVVKVDGDGFPVATLGSTSGLRVGEPALALASAFDPSAGITVTSGVVSALHRRARSRSGSAVLADLVQVDAPVAPGSAGGALVDAEGNVVGLVAAVAADEPGSEGMSFATPIERARTAAERLMSGGRTGEGWLGIQGDDLDGVTAQALRLDGGARVAEVITGSPAQTGGLAAQDVIVGIDGQVVTSMRQLVAELRRRGPGDRVSLGVVRAGERLTLSLVLAERPVR